MTRAGLPTPPGFTITTAACNDYFAAGEQFPNGLWDDVLDALRDVERQTGKGFGDAANPLLVSVRSGAKFSMPGMMDTARGASGTITRSLASIIDADGSRRNLPSMVGGMAQPAADHLLNQPRHWRG